MKALLAAVSSMYAFFEKPIDDFAIDLWVDALQPYREEDAVVAIKKAMMESKYIPKIPEVKKYLEDSTAETMTAAEQWRSYRGAINSASPTFSDPITAYLAQNVVNIWEAKNGTEENLKWVEKKFIESYKQIAGDDQAKANIEAKSWDNRLLAEPVRKQLEPSKRSMMMQPEQIFNSEGSKDSIIANSDGSLDR